MAAKAGAKRGDHLLVYQTAAGNDGLKDTLKKSGLPVRAYGMIRDLKEDTVDDNITFRPFSEQGFIDDLATSRGVIAGGGFTLMGEAVFLHKPMLAVPLSGQFEQTLNARYLAREGFGAAAETLDDPATVVRGSFPSRSELEHDRRTRCAWLASAKSSWTRAAGLV